MTTREIDRVDRQGPDGGVYLEDTALSATTGAALVGADSTALDNVSGATVAAQVTAVDGFASADLALDCPVVSYRMPNPPAGAATVSYGGVVYEFVDVSGAAPYDTSLAANVAIPLPAGATAAAMRAALIAAANGKASAHTTPIRAAGGPALAPFNQPLGADVHRASDLGHTLSADGVDIRFQPAISVGGPPRATRGLTAALATTVAGAAWFAGGVTGATDVNQGYPVKSGPLAAATGAAAVGMDSGAFIGPCAGNTTSQQCFADLDTFCAGALDAGDIRTVTIEPTTGAGAAGTMDWTAQVRDGAGNAVAANANIYFRVYSRTGAGIPYVVAEVPTPGGGGVDLTVTTGTLIAQGDEVNVYTDAAGYAAGTLTGLTPGTNYFVGAEVAGGTAGQVAGPRVCNAVLANPAHA
jgi:hypothetical protein